jgi:hypothetical protein
VIFGDLPTNLCVIADRFDAHATSLGVTDETSQPSAASGPPKRRLASAADPDRRTALLKRPRQQRQIPNRMKLSIEVNLLFGP